MSKLRIVNNDEEKQEREANKRTCSHPDFKYCSVGAYPFTFVFGRDHRKQPSDEQVAEYERKQKIVEANDGRMRFNLYDLGDEIPAFSLEDVAAMSEAVRRANFDLKIEAAWNGAGSRSFSVGCIYRGDSKKGGGV